MLSITFECESRIAQLLIALHAVFEYDGSESPDDLPELADLPEAIQFVRDSLVIGPEFDPEQVWPGRGGQFMKAFLTTSRFEQGEAEWKERFGRMLLTRPGLPPVVVKAIEVELNCTDETSKYFSLFRNDDGLMEFGDWAWQVCCGQLDKVLMSLRGVGPGVLKKLKQALMNHYGWTEEALP